MLKISFGDGDVLYAEMLYYDELNHQFNNGGLVYFDPDEVDCIEACDVVPRMVVTA